MKSFIRSRKDEKVEVDDFNDEEEYFKWKIRDLNRRIRDFSKRVNMLIEKK